MLHLLRNFWDKLVFHCVVSFFQFKGLHILWCWLSLSFCCYLINKFATCHRVTEVKVKSVDMNLLASGQLSPRVLERLCYWGLHCGIQFPNSLTFPSTAQSFWLPTTGNAVLQHNYFKKSSAVFYVYGLCVSCLISNRLLFDCDVQIELMLRMGVKAEIQCLYTISHNFLTDVYLPNKLQYGGWI